MNEEIKHEAENDISDYLVVSEAGFVMKNSLGFFRVIFVYA